MPMQPTSLKKPTHWISVLLLCTLILSLGACARKFSVSVNEQVLYDPRDFGRIVSVADAGLQSCINLVMQQREFTSADQIQVIACPSLEIERLDGIRELGNLRFLDVAGNRLVHLDELRHLSRLSSVNAPDNALQDISGILSIASLTSAVLTGNNSIPCTQLDSLAQRLGPNLLRPENCSE
jgi:Leucine-rich repeat (LRR) protein